MVVFYTEEQLKEIWDKLDDETRIAFGNDFTTLSYEEACEKAMSKGLLHVYKTYIEQHGA